MKKFTKVSLIAAVVCMAAGTAAITVGAAMDDQFTGRFSYVKEEIYNEVTGRGHHVRPSQKTMRYEVTEDKTKLDKSDTLSFSGIKELDIEVDGGSVNVIQGLEGSDIQVQVTDGENRTKCYVEDGNELKIQMERGSSDSGAREITVTIPKEVSLLKTGVEVKNGGAQIEGLTTGELELDSYSSEITLSNVTAARSVEAEAFQGSITGQLLGSKKDFYFQVEIEDGTIVLGSEVLEAGKYEGHFSGDETKILGAGQKEADLDCQRGSIELTFSQD